MLQIRENKVIIFNSLWQDEGFLDCVDSKIISEIEISCMTLSADVIKRLAALMERCNITRVNMVSCLASTEILQLFLKVVASFRNIECLESTATPIGTLDHHCLQIIATMNLEKLSLHGNSFNHLSLPVSPCPLSRSLTGLNLNGTILESVGSLCLFLTNCVSLRRIFFKCGGLSDKSVGQILEALQNLPHLKHIDLAANYCCNMKAIAKLMEYSVSIENLDLSYQLGGSMDVSELTRALPFCGTLKVLRLAGNNLHDEHISVLAQALALKRTHLHHLDISSNSISDEGLQILGEALASNTHLKYLNVKSNNFMNMDSMTLSENYSLETLHHSCKRCTTTSQIEYFCRLNQGGRRLLLRQPDIKAGLWPKVLQPLSESNNVDALYYFLRFGPIW